MILRQECADQLLLLLDSFKLLLEFLLACILVNHELLSTFLVVGHAQSSHLDACSVEHLRIALRVADSLRDFGSFGLGCLSRTDAKLSFISASVVHLHFEIVMVERGARLVLGPVVHRPEEHGGHVVHVCARGSQG